MRLRLNGWQRLWVVVASVYSIMVCLVSVLNFPDGASLETEGANFAVELALLAQVDAAQASGNELAELNALEDLAKGAAQVRRDAYGGLTDTELIQHIRSAFDKKANFAALDEKAARDIESLRKDRLRFALEVAAWWIIPLMVLYVLGSAIGWVARGFRNRSDV